MKHVFSRIPKAYIERSTFNRSHDYKTTFNENYLIPFLVDEVLPGDTVQLNVQLFCRVSTLISPIMDNLYLDTFFFFVPNRLIWSHWQNFCGEQVNPSDSTDYVVPVLGVTPSSSIEVGSLLDYMGLPTVTPAKSTFYFSSLPVRAYYRIWNEWFRDENLQDSIFISYGDDDGDLTSSESSGGLTLADPFHAPENATVPAGITGYTKAVSLCKRGKRHDYFTSCLPWTQKGDAPDLAFGGSAPVSIPAGAINIIPTQGDLPLYSSTSGNGRQWPWSDSAGTKLGAAAVVSGLSPAVYDSTLSYRTYTPSNGGIWSTGTSGSGNSGDLTGQYATYLGNAAVGESAGITANLSAASTNTINALREAFQIQKFLEKCARGGTRYTEILRSHFGVVSPDARLQRTEYLGGGSTMIQISQVPQTASTDSTSPQGNLAAYGISSSRQNGFSKSFVEHGYIIGLCCVRGDLSYQQGLNRMWSRQTKYDFYWPVFAHLGEQAVLNKEIYLQGDSTDDDVFGYQERYAEYRYFPSMVTGQFRSTYSTSLDNWHLAQHFSSLPTLGSDFIEENVPVERIVAVPSEPHFLLDAHFNMRCTRPMPMYGVPGLVDHF